MRVGLRLKLWGVLAALFLLLAVAPGSANAWSSGSLPAGVGGLSGVSCVGNTGRCVAVGIGFHGTGVILISYDGGLFWSRSLEPSGVGAIYDVSCASTSRCLAVGASADSGHPAAILSTHDGGQNWDLQTLPEVQAPASISCLALTCVASGPQLTGALVSHDGGGSWTLQPYQPACQQAFCVDSFDAIAGTLATPQIGFLVGGNQCGGQGVTQCPGGIAKTIDGGRTWHRVFTGYPFVDRISCADVDHCWAAAATFKTGVILATADGGSHWTRESLPAFSGYFNGISCVQLRHTRCIAVGQDPHGRAAVIATLIGSRWQLESAHPGTGALYGVSNQGLAPAVGFAPSRTRAVAIYGELPLVKEDPPDRRAVLALRDHADSSQALAALLREGADDLSRAGSAGDARARAAATRATASELRAAASALDELADNDRSSADQVERLAPRPRGTSRDNRIGQILSDFEARSRSQSGRLQELRNSWQGASAQAFGQELSRWETVRSQVVSYLRFLIRGG